MLTYFKYNRLSKYSNLNAGFTVTELIVVMGIASVLMTTLVVQQNKWNDNLALSTQAYELALMIRQAQIYSLAVKELASASGDKFNVGYGVYFDQNYTRYIMFGDKNVNGKYDTGENIETKTFTKGVLIDRFCGTKGGGAESDVCSNGSGNVAFMHVSFLRPALKANTYLLNNGSNPSNNVISPAIIHLKSPGGLLKIVKVEANGQIYVQ